MTFSKGDIVRVEFASPRAIEQWMRGAPRQGPGPGDVGVVKYTPAEATFPNWPTVTVEFPMLGTFGVHSSNLKLVQRFEKSELDIRADSQEDSSRDPHTS